jgi:signal transduction histidine kinase
MVAVAFLIPLCLMVQQLAKERALAHADRQTAVVIAVLTATTDQVSVGRAIATLGPPADGQVAVHGLAGGTVGQGRARAEDIARASRQRQAIAVDVPGGQSYLEPVDVGNGRTAVVEVFVPDTDLRRGVNGALYALCLVAFGLVIASVIVGDRLAARVVGSARGLAAAAGSLGNGDMDVRVRPSGPRELMEAGYALNTMADRMVALLASERELVADMSHRLRTPLTALRLDAETLGDSRGAERIRRAIIALELQIDVLIRAARKQAAPVVDAEELPTCDASEVVRDRMKFWSAVASDQGRRCEAVGVDAPAPVPLLRAELAAALDALLGNVFRYTPQGAPLEVTLSRRDGYVVIRVDDGGPGIPDPDRALRRGASDGGSTGLGLDIVRRVAVAAQGAVNVGQSQLGGASVVVMMIDVDRPPPSGSRFGLVGRRAWDPEENRLRRRRGRS